MHNTDKMNKTELRKIIQESIKEILNEGDISPEQKAAKDAQMKAIDAKIKALQIQKGDLASGREEITEDNIDELANVAITYTLTPGANAADFTGKKARIVNAMQETGEPMSKTEVAVAMGYDKQNPINADFMALVANGTIQQSEQQAAPRLARPQAGGEEGEEEQPTPEDEYGLSGREEIPDEEIDAMFAAAARAGEEEPEGGELETGDKGVSGQMSDEDYDAFMKYSDLSDRLASVKSNILKAKRSKSTLGDLTDEPSTSEVERLVTLKQNLQQKMDDLLASSPYLQARQAKINKKSEPEKTEEPEELDEWTKNNWQYYAGIKK